MEFRWLISNTLRPVTFFYKPPTRCSVIWRVCAVPANLHENCAELWNVTHPIWVPQLCHFDVWVYIRQTGQKKSYEENKDHFLCSFLTLQLSVLNWLRLSGRRSQCIAGCNRWYPLTGFNVHMDLKKVKTDPWSAAIFYSGSYPRLNNSCKKTQTNPPFWNPWKHLPHDPLLYLIPDCEYCINKLFSNTELITFISAAESLILYCGVAEAREWPDAVAMKALIRSYQFCISDNCL